MSEKPLCKTCGGERVAVHRKRKDGRGPGIWVLGCPSCLAGKDKGKQKPAAKSEATQDANAKEKGHWLDGIL